MRIPNTVDEPFRWLTSFLVLVFPTAVLFLNHGDSIALGLLGLIGLWAWIRGGAQLRLGRETRLLWLIFAVYFAVVLLSYIFGLQTEDGFHYLGRYLRFLFVVPVYLAFRRFPPTAKTAFIGLALGALLAGGGALLEFLKAREPIRMAASTDLSIIFGDLATSMVLCTVAGFGLMAASRRVWSVSLLVLCLAGGVAAALLSGTRGAWLPLFLLIPAMVTPAAGFLKRRYLLAILAVMIAAFSSSYFITRTDTQGRLKDAVRSTRGYFIGLHILHMEHSVTPFKPNCIDQPDFLQAWLDYFHSPDKAQLSEAMVVEDPLIKRTSPCAGDHVIRLHNSNRSKWAGYAFPRLAQDQAPVQSGKMLVRGTAVVILSKTKQFHIHVDSQRYTDITLSAPDWPGKIVRIYIAPNKTAWLAPLDSYPGEYAFSIADTSVGKRFEMWRAAWKLFLRHPLLGVGTGAYEEKTEELIKKGQVAPFIGNYDHPHNDYLDALASRGIPGFIALLALLLIPVRRFLYLTANEDRILHALGLAGALTVTGFAIYGLTDTVFLHSIMITWYVIYVALFYALIETRIEKINPQMNGNERPIPTPGS